MPFTEFRNVEKDKYEVIGTVPGVTSSNEEEENGPLTIRPNRFRPKAGIREQLRTNQRKLQKERESLNDANQEGHLEYEDLDETFTLSPPRTR